MLRKLPLFLAFTVVCLLTHNSTLAQTNTKTFSSPVTRDTGGYRKFDSKAIAGKFHAGDDYYNSDLKVLAVNCGVVVSKIVSGKGDHGLGNTLIIRHDLMGGPIYSVYGHLASFASGIGVNSYVTRGQRIGTMGKSGSGSGGIVHLHFELKRSATLANPSGYGSVAAGTQYGYVPIKAGTKTATSATNYGYFKPSAYYGSVIAFCRN
jgi:murein DD-endopeptidase MepM/ murein hydrolase activator NlpD